jgi:hypothetical protein
VLIATDTRRFRINLEMILMKLLSKPWLWIAVFLLGGLSYWAYSFASTRATNAPPGNDDPPTKAVEPTLTQVNTGEAEAGLESAHFLDSKKCAICHSNSEFASAMRDVKNRPIAPYDLWQASMMANSSRDPFWRAVLSAEVVATPSKKALIEEKCTRCHAPMAAPAPESPQGEVLAYLKNQDERSHLGLDGVSCTVCHQITDKNLGTKESFTGHFEINQDKKIYGPHVEPFTMPMQRHVGYTPTHSNHILKSGLCATCHTVITTSVDSTGQPTAGEFHEQMPYLEWRNSVFNDELPNPAKQAKSCQACHMPATDIEGNPIATRLAHNPGGRDFPFLKARQPFGRHAFLGGNTLMKRILRDNATELGVVASEAAFNQSIEQTIHFLGNQTANIEINPASFENGELKVPVVVRNLSGHKLPTAYPSRRVWIQFIVTDKDGKSVFASGNHNADGELIDSRGKVLDSELASGPVNKHKTLILEQDEVQVYETIMGDAENNPTFTLLRGATYTKDNRLLPLGWKADHTDGPATRPYGIGDDQDFTGGSDSIVYQFAVPADGDYTVSAKLLFQVITPRHANELFKFETPEVKRFRDMFEKANRTPETLAAATRKVIANNN